MEERLGEMRKERIEKGNHCFFKSSGYDKLELKQTIWFFQAYIECIIIMSWCETVCKNVPLVDRM